MHDHTDCTDSHCSRLFNLCENSCINGQEPPTDPEEAPANSQPFTSQATTELGSVAPTPVNACPDIICTPTTTVHTVTVPTNIICSTTRQSSCIPTSNILPTTTKIQEIPTNVTHTITITCPQSTAGLVTTTVTQGTVQSKSCNTFNSTEIILTTVDNVSTVQQSCTPKLPQYTTQPVKSNSSIASLDLEACSCSESSVPAKGTDPSPNATSALGALLGISMVLLALVTAGWVWTCWAFKKRGGITKLNK